MTDESSASGPDDVRDADGGAEPSGDPPNPFVLRAVRAVLWLYMLPLVAAALLVVGVALAGWRIVLAVEHAGRRLLGKATVDPPAVAGAAAVAPRPGFPIPPHRRRDEVPARVARRDGRAP